MTCQTCGGPLTGRQRLYCQPNCRLIAHRARKAEKSRKDAPAAENGPRKGGYRQILTEDISESAGGRNATAAQVTIESLRTAGRLEAVDAFRIAAVRTLAEVVDALPTDAGLWQVYLAASYALVEATDDDSDALADVLGALQAEMGNEAQSETPDFGAEGSSSS